MISNAIKFEIETIISQSHYRYIKLQSSIFIPSQDGLQNGVVLVHVAGYSVNSNSQPFSPYIQVGDAMLYASICYF